MSEENMTVAAFMRKCFQEVLADNKPHRLKEIAAYAGNQARENGIDGDFGANQVFLAIKKTLENGNVYGQPCRGFYQTRIGITQDQQALLPWDHFDWFNVLDKAVELQNLLEAGFGRDVTELEMNAEEKANFEVIGKAVQENIDKVIDGLAIWIAQVEDHQEAPSQDNGFAMSM